jgi:hypothetical protein
VFLRSKLLIYGCNTSKEDLKDSKKINKHSKKFQGTRAKEIPRKRVKKSKVGM